jgi:tetratricopeptide (TPR) repeat protein
MTTVQKQQAVGVGVAGVALLFFGWQMARAPYPNEWAGALLSILGQDPFRPLSHPVWQLLMSAFQSLPGAGLLQAGHVVSAVTGALAVWLIYQVALLLQKESKSDSGVERARTDRSRGVTALVSALYLAVSLPMLVVATRAHPLALDLALLLGATLFTLLYRRQPLIRHWFGFALLYGVGCSEFATFILLAPFFFLWWVVLFWRSKTFRWGVVLGGLAVLAAGVGVSLLFCWSYAREPVARWREFDSVWMVYQHFLRDVYYQLRFSVPRQGWLIVFLTMVLPAAFAFRTTHEQADDLFTNLGLFAFRFVLLTVAVVVIFNLPGSPGRILGPSVTLVTPYALTALWAGQLIGFFHHAMSGNIHHRTRVQPRPAWPRRLALTLVLLALAGAGYLNAQRASVRQADPLLALARDVGAALGDRPILLSNGLLDSTLQWQALQEGRRVRLINRVRSGSPAYMRYLATWFEDPQLKSVAVVGFVPFFDRMMSSTSNRAEVLAIQDLPDLWSLQGMGWTVEPGFYGGRPLGEPTDVASLESAQAFVQRHRSTLGARAPRPALLGDDFARAARYLGVLANNLGFQWATQERWTEARAAYEAALDYQPDNASALANLGEIARAEKRDDEWAQLRDRFNRLPVSQLNPQQIIHQYGYMRNPALFLKDGEALMQAGLRDRGVERLQQALQFGTGGDAATLALAQALFDDGKFEASLLRFREVAERTPEQTAPWLGVLRCQWLLGRAAEAEETLSRLELMGLSAEALAVERGYMRLRGGAPADAVPLFEKALSHEPSRGAAAVGLALAAVRLNDQARMGKAIAALRELPDYFAGQMVLHEWAVLQKDFAAARHHMERARRLQPGNAEVLEKLIQLDLREEKEADARRLLDVLLSIDNNHPYGNYLLSGLHEQEGHLDLAEIALQRSMRNGAWPDACYGMAWILFKTDRPDEALDYIGKALKFQPQNPQYQAVKGMILGAQNNWTEAEALLKSAIALRTDRDVPLFSLHLALVYAQSGRTEEALEIAGKFDGKSDELTREEVAVRERVLQLAR